MDTRCRFLALVIGLGGSLLQVEAELIAYWDFDLENRYDDRSGNGADGSAGAWVEIDAGSPLGDGVAFGVSCTVPARVVSVPSAVAPTIGEGDFSFSFWVKRGSTAGDPKPVDGVFDNLAATTQGFQALFLGPGDSDRFRFRMDEVGADFLLADSSGSIATDGSWRHIAVTVDRDHPEGLIIYLDGEADATYDPTSVAGDLGPLQDLWIGGINNAPDLGLDGSLDDLSFYDVVLTPEQVLALATRRSTPLDVFSPPLAPQLQVSSDGSDLTIEWESEEGVLYRLRSDADLDVPEPATWPLFDPEGDGRFAALEATPPLNEVRFTLPPEATRFFVVEAFPPPPVVVFAEDFENGQGEWRVDSDGAPGTAWELGEPSGIGPGGGHASANCFGTNISGPYGEEADVWLDSPSIDLTDAAAATLTYYRFVDTEVAFDLGEVIVVDAADDSPLGVIEEDVDGLSSDWELVTRAIPASALGKTIILQFRLTTDDFEDMEHAGFYIDDIQVTVP